MHNNSTCPTANPQQDLNNFEYHLPCNATFLKKSSLELEILNNLLDLCTLFSAKAKKPNVLAINPLSSQR